MTIAQVGVFFMHDCKTNCCRWIVCSSSWDVPRHYHYELLHAECEGILTQELDPELRSKLPDGGRGYSAYLAASYVQWVMAGGARAVPVIIGRDEQYYRQVGTGNITCTHCIAILNL